MISVAAGPPLRSLLRRAWAPERLLGRHVGLRAYQGGLALACLLLLHALVINSLLLSGALGWLLTRATGMLRVDTGHSFSLWPGIVHLRQLQLEVTDSHGHLELEVPTGRANILLRELLRRRFATKSVIGEHFVLRFRPKFQALTERRRAALPPLSESGSAAGQGDAPYLWPIRVQGAAAQYDELWVSEVRYRGDAWVTGGFELVPLVHVSVDPSAVDLRGGSLSYGPDERVLDVQRVQVHAELQQTDVESLERQWSENASVRAEVAGSVVDVRFVANLLPELEGLSDGQAELTFKAAAERGQWDVFELEYAPPRISYANGAWSGSTALSLAAHAAAGGPELAPGSGQPWLPATVQLRGAVIDARGKPIARLEQCQLDLKLTPGFPIAIPALLSFDLHGLALAELDGLPKAFRPGHWVPRSLNLGRARASLAWREGVASGSAEAHFQDASFSYGDWSFRQNGKLALAGLHWRGPGFKLKLSEASLGLDSVRMRHPETQVDSWSVNVQLERVALAPLGQRLSADFLVAGDDARPVLSLLGVRGLAPGASNFLAMPDLRVRGSLELGPERQEVSIDRAESDTIDVRGRLIRQADQNHAVLLFRAAPLSLGVDVRPGDTSVKLFAGDAWLRTHLDRLASESAAGSPAPPPGGQRN